jgi:diadenosine tetraphosphate (Ap4A) HIT family hydrolase
MLSGEGCPMCADAHLVTNVHSDLVVASRVSYTRLHKNQTHPGYCIVILNRHERELHYLDDAELRQFWLDVTRVSRVIAELFQPVKLDTLIMGHLCPHVHCHVFPQYQHDDSHALVNLQEGTVRLTALDQHARVTAIQERLAAAMSPSPSDC